MATYFISDIHGEYELFCRLLDKIKFCQSDSVIVLGDFLEKGRHSVKLAKFMFSQPNIRAVFGNHEYVFMSYYQSYMRELRDGDDVNRVLERMQSICPGETEKLTWPLIDYVEDLPRYIETDDYICVHACVETDGAGRIIPLCRQDPNTFIFDRSLASANNVPKDSKTVLFGHTPCFYSNGTGRFIKTPRKGCGVDSPRIQDFAKIQLDNGVAYTKMLGVLRLEDMQEFYMKKD